MATTIRTIGEVQSCRECGQAFSLYLPLGFLVMDSGPNIAGLGVAGAIGFALCSKKCLAAWAVHRSEG